MRCRFCNYELTETILELGEHPFSNGFLKKEEIASAEQVMPLDMAVCKNCLLVQTVSSPDPGTIFNEEYIYYSSFSKSWVEHAKQYVEMIIRKHDIGQDKFIAEIASNDGYLLQHFLQKNYRVLGIEPSGGTASAARQKGIYTLCEYFCEDLAKQLATERKADLIIGNNVLAHVPDINNFVSGLKYFLNDSGIITLEFPHLMKLIDMNQFDTIYHEHYFYFSLFSVMQIFEKYGLAVFDVEEIPTHGGSLRVYIKHKNDLSKKTTNSAGIILRKESEIGMHQIGKYYSDFRRRVLNIKSELTGILKKISNENKRVIAYGAAAKGNTLLNYCGINADLIPFVADISVYKQGRYLPGSHIPVVSLDVIEKVKPDYIIILPWNIKDEIMKDLSYIKKWNGRFIIAIPEVKIMSA